jgi:hypothetical protein
MTINKEEVEVLLKYLYEIYSNSTDASIKRTAKSLFTLLTKEKYKN